MMTGATRCCAALLAALFSVTSPAAAEAALLLNALDSIECTRLPAIMSRAQ
jgi:hypothetical protein